MKRRVDIRGVMLYTVVVLVSFGRKHSSLADSADVCSDNKQHICVCDSSRQISELIRNDSTTETLLFVVFSVHSRRIRVQLTVAVKPEGLTPLSVRLRLFSRPSIRFKGFVTAGKAQV